MNAVITPTRRPITHRFMRLLRIWWLRWDIDSADKWVSQCERDGIMESDTLRYMRAEVNRKRVLLAMVEAS